ncbi:unnamed protein product [Microthlaspi erraticum]|uniref:PWWP domain-containing protein n=1 Tax=Microthlaspi erraticum TaxID=1685480 RepID=A0A6D2KTF1_9BRAS|nr:unnamed protein product [Microthlaspi erraticum]
MEVVLEIGEEARPKPCSSETGSAKQQDEPAEKTLGDDSTQENGVRVSENGEQKILGDVDEGDNKSKENVVVEEKLNGSGVIEDCVMNGVSSLLKLKQDVAEDEDGEEEEDDDEEHGYCVGDFVWGKIKNHPWWPGQIYDPSDASDLALKKKQKGKLLVAYFGDGTFAWCGPSQLKPFAESFNECSTASNSKSFVVAVKEAVEEMGRHMECLLICEKQKLDNPEAKNAGIKEGVLVRDVRREIISSLVLGKSEGILKNVRSLAETVSFNGLLELEVFKRKVSAFYRSQRGYGLTEYHEPQTVPGLEDKNNDDDNDEDVNIDERSSIEVEEKDEEEALDPGGSSVQRSMVKCSGFPDHRQQHRRKQKSIAEILENESSAMVRFMTEPSNGAVKSGRKKESATTPRRRRTSKLSAIEDKKVEENGNGETLSRKKKRSVVDDDGGSEDREESAHVVEETVKDEVSDPETDIDSTPLASLRKRVKVDAKKTENGETATLSLKRERKKSKYFSPEFLSDFSSRGRKKSKVESESSKAPSQSQAGDHQMTDASNSLAIVVMEEDNKLENVLGNEEQSEELSNAVEFLRLGATPTEMRDLIRVAALGIQYPKDSSSRDMVREFMSIYRSFTYHEGANSKVLGSYSGSGKETEELAETGKPETNSKERKDKKRKAKQQTEEIEQIGKEENESTKKERKAKKPKSKKQGDEEGETQKEAGGGSTKKERKPKKPKSKKEGDEEEEETVKEASESTKKERKPRKPKANKQADEEEGTGKESSEPRKKERKPKKPKEDETQKEAMEIEKPEKSEKEFSGAELFVTFGPGSTLPKKEELIEVYGKFGALDEERTFYTDLCAHVAFLNTADGEKAFESSLEKCPFAFTSKIKFRLKYPNERAEEKKPEAEVEVAEEKTMEVECVKKKLDEMRSLVDGADGGIMTEEVKVKLEDGIVSLLEKVRTMKSS